VLNHCRQLAQTDDPSRPGIVHRLDKDTSGCLLIAKYEEGLRKLGMQFEKRTVMKQYLALVWGKMEAFKGELELAIGRHPTDRKKMAVTLKGKPAHTTFEVVERFNDATLVRVFLRTGRTHQIRVHMAHLGHPVLGDSEYGKKGMELAKKIEISRQMLHAGFIGITHPRTNQWMMFSAPMPQDMEQAIEKLKTGQKVK
jgi:23S rRNA pseudouridine1911/1915/1917 synthase